jgi:hypothetical protein
MHPHTLRRFEEAMTDAPKPLSDIDLEDIRREAREGIRWPVWSEMLRLFATLDAARAERDAVREAMRILELSFDAMRHRVVRRST